MKNQLYRQLAAAGNVHAKRIVDAGVIPDQEMDPGESSESEELEGLVELSAAIQALIAKAAAHSESGDYMRAADVHMERGSKLEEAGEHQQAMGAYKDAALAMWRHADGCGYVAGYEVPQIRAIHARQNAEKGKQQ